MDINAEFFGTESKYASQRFRLFFNEEYFPQITCPTCKFGLLEMEPASFKFKETVDSVRARSDPDWDPDWIRYVFVGLLKCNNRRCSETVAFSGEGSVEPFDDYDAGEQHCLETFYPKFFVPSPDIFPIPPRCPQEVQSILRESFRIAWQDLSAAGNKLRVAIERMIDTINPGAGGKLHNKLEALKKTNQEVSDMLMSVKWIGNSGSHTAELKECDVAVAYQIMHKVLEKLYGNEQFLNDAVAKINQAMKPLK